MTLAPHVDPKVLAWLDSPDGLRWLNWHHHQCNAAFYWASFKTDHPGQGQHRWRYDARNEVNGPYGYPGLYPGCYP